MSWLARSLANSLRLDDGDGDYDDDGRRGGDSLENAAVSTTSLVLPLLRRDREEDDRSDPQGRGVKEDLSEFRETLTRQLLGVASFLAPPPSQSSTPSSCHAGPSGSEWNRSEPSDPSVSGDAPGEFSEEDTSYAAGISGIRSQSLKTGISNPSNHSSSSEISKTTSNFLHSGVEQDDPGSADEYDFRGVVGITEEVLTFATNIAMHPETWLDFPLEEEQELDDFQLSDAQRQHALAVEHLLPRLAALRIELCPNHMTKGYFWKVYFVLLHSRLNKKDSDLLSTPLLASARARWMHELRMLTNPEEDQSKRSTLYSQESANLPHEDHLSSLPSQEIATQKPGFGGTNIDIEKLMIEESEGNGMVDDDDEWLHDEISEFGPFGGPAIQIGSQEDVSFSDLEDDEDGAVSVPVKP